MGEEREVGWVGAGWGGRGVVKGEGVGICSLTGQLKSPNYEIS
jgi:hypothetical protein